MKIEEYIKRLDPKKSYWWVKVREIEPLNDVRATTENLWIVFVCLKCSLEANIKVNTKITKKGKIKFTNLDNFLLYRIVKVFNFI